MFILSSMLAAIILGLIIKYYPHQNGDSAQETDFNGMESKYDKWETMAMIPFFIFLPILAFMFGDLTYNLFSTFNTKDKQAIFEMSPQYKYWFIPGGILGIALVFYHMKALYKMLLKTEYDNYMLYTNIKHGYNGVKVMKLFTFSLSMFAIIGFLLMADYSFRVYNNKIVFNNFLKLSPTCYNFQQVKSIHYILMSKDKKNKNSKINPHYTVEFKDQNIWKSESALSNRIINPSVALFISSKSKIKIDTLQTDP